MSKSQKQYIKDAISNFKEQRYQEALEAFEQAIQIDPNCVKALHGRGVIFTQMEEYKKAIESYGQATKLAPDVAKIHFDMAEVFYILKDYEKSGSSYRKAIQLEKIYESIYRKKEQELTNKALDFWRQRRGKEATIAFQQVLLFSPEDIQAPYYLSNLQKTYVPMTVSPASSFISDEPQPSKSQVGYEAVYNTQWNLSSSIHPANCRCAQCWEP